MLWQPILKKILGGAIAFVGIYFMLATAADIFSPSPSASLFDQIIAIIFLGLVPGILGTLVAWSAFKESKVAYNAYIKDQIYQLLEHKNGRIDHEDIAKHLHLTTKKAQQLLKQMQLKGHLDAEIESSGKLVYFKPIYPD